MSEEIDWRAQSRKWEARAKQNHQELQEQKAATELAQSLVVGQAEILRDIRMIIRDELENHLGAMK